MLIRFASRAFINRKDVAKIDQKDYSEFRNWVFTWVFKNTFEDEKGKICTKYSTALYTAGLHQFNSVRPTIYIKEIQLMTI